MRRLVFFFCLMCSILNAQLKVDSTTYKLSYQKIDTISISKQKLKEATEKWFATTFVDSKEVIRLSNEQNVIGKGVFKDNVISGKYSVPVSFRFTIDIAFKEGRYRFKAYDLFQSVTAGGNKLETPVLYFGGATIENYKELASIALQNIEDSKLRSQMIKQLQKQKITQKDVDKSLDMMKKTLNSVESNLELLAESLKQYLKDYAEDDW